MKEKIAEAALREFLKSGIRDMSVAKLIAPLRISTKTFYKHFESKEALLKECLNILYNGEQLRKIIDEPTDPVNKILSVFQRALAEDFGINHAFYHDLNYYYPDLQNEAIARVREKFGGMMIPVVEKGIEDGYFLEDLDMRVALTGINTLYTSITRGHEYGDKQSDPHLLFRNLVVVFVRGMCTKKGRKKIETNLKSK